MICFNSSVELLFKFVINLFTVVLEVGSYYVMKLIVST